MNKLTGCFFLSVSLLSLSACLGGPIGWQRISLNHPISPEQVAFIRDGETPLTEVVEHLGSPDDIVVSGDITHFRYYFGDGKYFRVNFGWGLRFLIPFYSPDMVLAGGGAGTNIFQVTCDDKWVAIDHSFAFHVSSTRFRFLPID